MRPKTGSAPRKFRLMKFAFQLFLMLPAAATTLATIEPSGAETETVTVIGKREPIDLCLKVAEAKFAQWAQERVLVREMQTFADGTKTDSETIFTENAAYGHRLGHPWNTIQIVLRQRVAPSPEVIARNMKLADCQLLGPTQEAGQQATLYAYDYLPDADGSTTSGKIWISETSGLPLRQELQQRGQQPDPKVAENITAHYFYDSDVQIPLPAIQAENTRRLRVQQWVRDMQDGRASMGP